MKKMIKLISTFMIALLLIITLSGCKEASNELHIGFSPDYAPYEFVDLTKEGNDKYVGADIELAKYICEELDKELVLEPMGFGQILISLQSGKIDLAISGFTYEDERAKNFEFSEEYFVEGEGRQVVITLVNNLTKYDSFEKVNQKGVKVGAQAGSVQYNLAVEQLTAATIEPHDNIANMVTYLEAGKIDCISISETAANALISTNNNIAMVPGEFEVEDSGLYVLAEKGNVELMNKVNTVIKDVKENKLYETWMEEASILFEELGDNAGQIDMSEKKFSLLSMGEMFIEYFPDFMMGLGITLALSLVGVVCASLFGIILCLMNISKYKTLKAISSSYIEIIRGIPLLLQLGVLFVVMPTGTSKFITCSIALVINSSAYQAEIFRSGIQSIDKGQMEAARSLGMSYWQTMIKIIIPQAVRNILPSLANEFVVLIKETSIASTFYVGDLMTVKQNITTLTFDSLTPFFIVAIIYFIVTFSLSKLIKTLEKKVAL